MKKYIIGSVIVLIAIIVTGFILTQKTSAPGTENSKAVTSRTDSISAATVSTHSSKSDCWTTIDGSVYNITEFVSSHPGGDVIVQACGTDGTDLFNNREGNGKKHSPTADVILAKYKIGEITN